MNMYLIIGVSIIVVMIIWISYLVNNIKGLKNINSENILSSNKKMTKLIVEKCSLETGKDSLNGIIMKEKEENKRLIGRIKKEENNNTNHQSTIDRLNQQCKVDKKRLAKIEGWNFKQKATLLNKDETIKNMQDSYDALQEENDKTKKTMEKTLFVNSALITNKEVMRKQAKNLKKRVDKAVEKAIVFGISPTTKTPPMTDGAVTTSKDKPIDDGLPIK